MSFKIKVDLGIFWPHIFIYVSVITVCVKLPGHFHQTEKVKDHCLCLNTIENVHVRLNKPIPLT